MTSVWNVSMKISLLYVLVVSKYSKYTVFTWSFSCKAEFLFVCAFSVLRFLYETFWNKSISQALPQHLGVSLQHTVRRCLVLLCWTDLWNLALRMPKRGTDIARCAGWTYCWKVWEKPSKSFADVWSLSSTTVSNVQPRDYNVYLLHVLPQLEPNLTQYDWILFCSAIHSASTNNYR